MESAVTPDPARPLNPTRQETDEPPPPHAPGSRCAVIVLAAGYGTRMRSKRAKLLHTVAGRPMIDNVLHCARVCDPAQLVVVVGHQADELRRHHGGCADVAFAVQEQLLGTGHAVGAGLPALADNIADVVVLFADHPLITPEMVAAVLAEHRRSGAVVTMASCIHPTGGLHGRLTRDAAGRILRVTEARDAVGEVPGQKEINSGIHCFDRAWLATALPRLTRQSNGEYYLTELVELAAREGDPSGEAPWPVAAAEVDVNAAMGVNNRVELANAERIARRWIAERHMLNGVTIVDPASTFIDYDVTIGQDTVIYPCSFLQGQTSIGADCTIGPGARIRDSVVHDGARVLDSTVEESEIGPGTDIGPYSHLRPGARVAGGVHVGNYVEIKNSTVGAGTAIGHVSYLGDATIGEQVNIGAGAITSNYDGREKHRTVVGDGAFIGVNTILRAPVEVGPGAYTGGGAFVNRDVPAGQTVVGIPARPIVRQARDDAQAASDGTDAAADKTGKG
jgi:bifunctional UDP-N-acetylglucosamine pyrophosphorylase/glucosamine-1-phosphate N-acetyltransferase